jgi:hypothetical protein
MRANQTPQCWFARPGPSGINPLMQYLFMGFIWLANAVVFLALARWMFGVSELKQLLEDLLKETRELNQRQRKKDRIQLGKAD